eukprot:jgi/Tetstr1/463658/TSEL_008519.t1
MQPWWAAGLAVPALVARGVMSARGKNKGTEEGGPEDEGAGSSSGFVCERVCTSAKLLQRMGGLAKDPTPNTCVTVCGVSSNDACVEACQRVVCAEMHQVPDWNDQCLKRCTTECLKGRAH